MSEGDREPVGTWGENAPGTEHRCYSATKRAWYCEISFFKRNLKNPHFYLKPPSYISVGLKKKSSITVFINMGDTNELNPTHRLS